MSRDLGPKQLFLLQWAGRWRGAPVAIIAEEAGLSQRRALKLIESLRKRGKVVVVDDPDLGDRRCWTPDAHDRFVRALRDVDHFREEVMLNSGARWGVECDRCGHFCETVTPTRPRHSYRSKPKWPVE